MFFFNLTRRNRPIGNLKRQRGFTEYTATAILFRSRPHIKQIQVWDFTITHLSLGTSWFHKDTFVTKRVMGHHNVATSTSPVKKPKRSLWWRIQSFFGAKKRSSSNPKLIENDEDVLYDITKSLRTPYEGNSNAKQLQYDESRRRFAVCAVLEERQLYFGTSLSELRKDLIVHNLLDKLGLL